MVQTTTKRGRPTAAYRTRAGETIPGLTRKSDGRWRVSATGKTFVEPDEHLAVARFLEMTRPPREVVRITVDAAPADSADRVADLVARLVPNPREVTDPLDVQFAPLPDLTGPHGRPTKLHLTPDGTLEAYRDEVESPAFWAYLRHLLLTEPARVAKMTGVEQVAWVLQGVAKPEASPTLDEVGELYFAKPKLSPNELSRSRLFWAQFAKAVGVRTVREVDHAAAGRYEAVVAAAGLKSKSVLHRYRKVRSVLAYAVKRGRGPADCRKALDATAMLEVTGHTPLDPRPIRPDDFAAVHKVAVDAGDATFAAMMVTALNCAMYSGEVAALLRDELDLRRAELVTRRPKTGVSRVAVLWPETVAAINGVPARPEVDFAFNSRHRSHTNQSVLKVWNRYRDAAGVGGDVTFGSIRDAAFTVACRVSLDQARVLAGHRLPGASDHYLRRNPQFVAGVCEAIRREYGVESLAGVPVV